MSIALGIPVLWKPSSQTIQPGIQPGFQDQLVNMFNL
jgi:hypothetical protein